VSGVPLSYFTGLGAVSAESLAAQGMDAERKAKDLRAAGQTAQADMFQRQADSLYAQARTAGSSSSTRHSSSPPGGGTVSSSSVNTQQPSPAPQQSVVYRSPQIYKAARGAFGFKSSLAPLADLFGEPAPQPRPSMTSGRLWGGSVPTWAWVAGAAAAFVLAGAALKKRSG